jgi:hypothetical protein
VGRWRPGTGRGHHVAALKRGRVIARIGERPHLPDPEAKLIQAAENLEQRARGVGVDNEPPLWGWR